MKGTRNESAAIYATIPKGFGVVRSGDVRPDDMLFVWPGGGWLRADSPYWTSKTPDDAADAVCVTRFGHVAPRVERMPSNSAAVGVTGPGYRAQGRAETVSAQMSLF